MYKKTQTALNDGFTNKIVGLYIGLLNFLEKNTVKKQCTCVFN